MSYTSNLYELLEIPSYASRDEIKKAYKKKAKIFHPDVNRQSNAHIHFLLIQQAYQTLINPDTRLKYDQSIASGSSYILSYAEWKKIEEEKLKAKAIEEERLFQEKRKRFQQRKDLPLLHLGLYLVLIMAYTLAASIVLAVAYLLIVYHWILFFTTIPLLGLSFFLFKYTFEWFKKMKRFF
jgi:hypothetical protein